MSRLVFEMSDGRVMPRVSHLRTLPSSFCEGVATHRCPIRSLLECRNSLTGSNPSLSETSLRRRSWWLNRTRTLDRDEYAIHLWFRLDAECRIECLHRTA